VLGGCRRSLPGYGWCILVAMRNGEAAQGGKMAQSARSVLAGVLVAALAAVLIFNAPARSAPSKLVNGSCGPVGATTLAGDRQVRIYAPDGSASGRNSVYACLRPAGFSRRLGPIRPSNAFFNSSMTGPFGWVTPWTGGFERRAAGQDGFYVYVAALNLRTGRGNHCLVDGANHPISVPGKLLINHRGTTAWAAEATGSGGVAEIAVCYSAGRQVIAEGTSIEADSVSLHGLTLSWTESGVRRSVLLTH
jgi:hypothetical protein